MGQSGESGTDFDDGSPSAAWDSSKGDYSTGAERGRHEYENHSQLHQPPRYTDPGSCKAFDDANPIAPSDAQRSGGVSPRGNSWDRVRQRAAQGQNSSVDLPEGQASEGSRISRQMGVGDVQFGQSDRYQVKQPSTDSFSFSSSDEERQLARAEAQKEFDERIERERQGKDFGWESDKPGVWGRRK